MNAPALWLDRVGAVAARIRPAGLGWLGASERRRLQGIGVERRRDQFIAGRWVARALLAAVHGGDALRDWALEADADSPPAVAGGPHAGHLHIALAHSADHVACAIDTSPLGIDIEVPRPRGVQALIDAVCTGPEQLRLRVQDPASREAGFLEIWTLKEAWVKRQCGGVSVQRLAALSTQPVERGKPADAWSWRCGDASLALVARAAPPALHADAASLGEPRAWSIADLTSP